MILFFERRLLLAGLLALASLGSATGDMTLAAGAADDSPATMQRSLRVGMMKKGDRVEPGTYGDEAKLSEGLEDGAKEHGRLLDAWCANGFLRGDICCAGSCGRCGGTGCSKLPGGASNCCGGSISSAGRVCEDFSDTSCIVDASSGGGSGGGSGGSSDKDAFGIDKLYASDPEKTSHDWLSKWSGSQRTLERAGQADPQDSQTVMKGKSSDGITIGSDECVFNPGIPRLFINKAGAGYENVEFTAYANWMKGGKETSNAGFTMIGRTDHFLYKDNGCNAVGYIMRIWEGSNKEGRVSFQKEYYHGDKDKKLSLSDGFYTDLFPDFPKNQWIGMKFVIFTIPGTKKVQLELYIDRTDGQSGGDWKLEHTFVDEPGAWRNTRDSFPSSCKVKDGDTNLGERHSCALRTDGGEVHWKKASIRHILPDGSGTVPTAPTPTAPTPTAPTPTAPTPTAPTPTATQPTPTDGWTVITSDDFEAGWGSYAEGGSDAKLYDDGTYAHQGNNAVEIRDDRDGFFTHISEHDVSAFSQLRVSFWFIAVDMETDHHFWLQYSTNGGSQWINEQVWIYNVDFENERFYKKEVIIDSRQMNGIKLRFRCISKNNGNAVFLDEIEFEGK